MTQTPEHPLIEAVPYTEALSREWNDFNLRAKNGSMLFDRNYMDYHADRFEDCSLMLTRNGRLWALLPASRHGVDGGEVRCHGGLTFGALVLGDKGATADVLEAFRVITAHYAAKGAKSLVYKPVPHIWHTLPAEEDLYALFRMGAVLEGRNVSSTVDLSHPPKWRNIRMAGVRKATAAGITVRESDDYPAFWEILTRNLHDRHDAAPVHSLAEMQLLASRFPGRIRLHAAFAPDGTMLAGTVIYRDRGVAHTQYISASPGGKASGALDLLYHSLITEVYANERYFDFGTSNLDGGHYLNESLIYQKEGFGGRAVCFDTYRLDLTKHHPS